MNVGLRSTRLENCRCPPTPACAGNSESRCFCTNSIDSRIKPTIVVRYGAAARPDAPGATAHPHLGRRPRHRATRHVRRPAPRRAGRPGAEDRRDRRPPGVALRGPRVPEHRAQRGHRAAERGMEHGTRPVRRNAPRLLGYRCPDRRHGPRGHLGVAELPVADRRVLGHGVLEERRPRARPRGVAGLERLASRGVGRRVPGPDHPAAAAVAGRPAAGGRRATPQRRARLQGRELPRAARPVRAAQPAHRGVGSVPGRVRGDRAPSSACTPAPRSGRRSPRRTPRSRPSRRCSR